MQQIHQVTHYSRPKHIRKSTKKKYWFKCLHSLTENPNFETMRKKQISFNIYLGHYNIPVSVEIKKIKHLKRSRFGKRVKLNLVHQRGDQIYYITAIFNRDNSSMVINLVPKFLFLN